MKKFFFFIFLTFTCANLRAQIFEPVHWHSEVRGDSVLLTAVPDSGWHITIFSINDNEINEEITGEYRLTLALQDAKTTKIRYNACDDQTCTAPEVFRFQDEATSIVQDDLSPDTNARSPWTIFLLGLLGGFLAIFTPCVWPIIPMTVSFFLKQEASTKNSILFGGAIVVIYVGLGLLVTILFGASALNALSTNAIVNLFFFSLLIVFALSFFGLFEIRLPSSWANALDSKAHASSGIVSILLMAFTLVIVSFSCTGPIIGTLLVEAAGRSLLAPAIGMLGFSLALAIPFTLFSLFPHWLKKMPRSGGWMNTLKVALAFVELAFALKFFSVADMAYGWGLLPRKLFIALWSAIFLLLGLYLLGALKRVLPDDETFAWKNKPWNIHHYLRGTLAILTLAFTAYLLPGLNNAPVKAIAAFAPPMPIEAKTAFYDYEEGMQFARQENRPVIIDFSGYGCVNCRKMEAYVLDNEKIKQRLEKYVLITLFVDDKHPYKNGKETIGDFNSRLQRERFKANAQPFFVQLSPDGEMVAKPCAFTTSPDEFEQWLVF